MTARIRPLFTKAFWLDAGERVARSAGQFALAAWGQDALGFDTFHATLSNVAAAALSGAILTLLTAIAAAPINDNSGSPASVLSWPPPPPPK